MNVASYGGSRSRWSEGRRLLLRYRRAPFAICRSTEPCAKHPSLMKNSNTRRSRARLGGSPLAVCKSACRRLFQAIHSPPFAIILREGMTDLSPSCQASECIRLCDLQSTPLPCSVSRKPRSRATLSDTCLCEGKVLKRESGRAHSIFARRVLISQRSPTRTKSSI